MFIDLTKIFSWSYLSSAWPEIGFSWLFRFILLGICLLILLVAIGAGLKNKQASGPSKKAYYKLQTWGWVMGSIGLLLILFREVHAIYLSSRIYLLLWLLVTLYWLLTIMIYWKKTVPVKAKQQQAEQEFKKWLPTAKK